MFKYYVIFVNSFFYFIGATSLNETSYRGILSPDCASKYFRLYVSRQVPPRTYQYHHEYRMDPDDHPASRRMMPFQWRIVGGKAIMIEEAPYSVLYGMYCGGSLIAPEWVITAAHCKDRETFIVAGSTRRSLGLKYPICAHFIHPGWNISNLHSHDFDYQLVLLSRPVPVTPQSRPVAIGQIDDVVAGGDLFVTGWGHMKYKNSKMQDILRRVKVPIMATEVCKSLPHSNYKKITPRMFCAGYLNGTKDSCQGDSGGPGVINGKLVGLVSFGVGCAAPDQPGVYSNIPQVREWIRQITSLPL